MDAAPRETSQAMSGEERVAYLVKLAMEAHDAVYTDVDVVESEPFKRRLVERMRQAAHVWGAEVDAREVSR